MDEFITHAKKLQQPGNADFFPVAYGGLNGFERVAAEVRRWGGEFFDVPAGAGKKAMLDSGPAQQMFRWFYDNTKAGLFAPRVWSAAEFGQGKTAFLFGHLAGQRATVQNNAKGAFEWTFNIVPKGSVPRCAAVSSTNSTPKPLPSSTYATLPLNAIDPPSNAAM